MRIGTGLVKLAVAAAVLTSVSAVMAQGGGGRGGFGGRGVTAIQLLRIDAVQTELKLSEEQKSSVQTLIAQQPSFQDQQNLSQEERQQRMAETQKKVDEILLPPQRERLNEILLQLTGARALTRPEVAEKLKLTDDQKTKIEEAFASLRRGGGGGGGGGGAAGFQAAMEEANKKAMDALTAEQRDQFTKMQGEKVNIDMSQLRGGRGQGGQGGGRQRKGGQPDA